MALRAVKFQVPLPWRGGSREARDGVVEPPFSRRGGILPPASREAQLKNDAKHRPIQSAGGAA
jgi:hypothetical protein